MRKTKRIIAACLASVLTLTAISPISSLADDSETAPKAEAALSESSDAGTEYAFDKDFCESYTVKTLPTFADAATLTKYAELLVRLNIMSGYDDRTIALDKNVTRAEAAKLVLSTTASVNAEMIEKGKLAADLDAVFSDVSRDSWYWGYVMFANASFGLGYGDGTFLPENNVSEIELLAMTERAMGYSKMIDAEGGYPSGVISVAKRVGLDKAPRNIPATRARTAEILYNALHSNMMLVTGFMDNPEGFEMEYDSTCTVMYYNDIYKLHGTLKKSDTLPDKTMVFIPSENGEIDGQALAGGREYTFIKEYTDIPEGEYDVYFVYDNDDYECRPIIAAAL